MCSKFCFDVAVGEDRGRRPTQEDFVIANFPEDLNAGLAVLSDGMGGHDDSILASRFLVTGVAGELSVDLEGFHDLEDDLPNRLEALTQFANLQLGSFMRQRGIQKTMGATLLSIAVSGDKLFWASVGDSALYLVRDGAITRLNADHSMSPQIDFMVEAGMISKENATNHPDRNILTSAIYGKKIKKMDCPITPFALKEDDLVLLASDGLGSLSSDDILKVVAGHSEDRSSALVEGLLAAVLNAGVEDQDNTALVAIRVRGEDHVIAEDPPCASAPATPWSLEASGRPVSSGLTDSVAPSGETTERRSSLPPPPTS